MTESEYRELGARFLYYNYAHGMGVWGSLHVALDDYNVDDYSVRSCLTLAQERGDIPGVELAKELLKMKPTARNKLAHRLNENPPAYWEPRDT